MRVYQFRHPGRRASAGSYVRLPLESILPVGISLP